MVAGFAQLEVGFDTRDNFDQSVPVVQDFFLIADEFQSSPAPLYIVINGDVISEDGRDLYNEVVDTLLEIRILTGFQEESGIPSEILHQVMKSYL